VGGATLTHLLPMQITPALLKQIEDQRLSSTEVGAQMQATVQAIAAQLGLQLRAPPPLAYHLLRPGLRHLRVGSLLLRPGLVARRCAGGGAGGGGLARPVARLRPDAALPSPLKGHPQSGADLNHKAS